MDATLRCPFIMQVIGPSQSGKTSFVGRLIRHSGIVFEKPIDELVWYTPHHDLPAEISHHSLPFKLTVRHNLPHPEDDENESDDGDSEPAHRVFVLDDFGDEAKNNRYLSELYTRGSHHRGITLIQVMQNLFLPSKESRTRSLNVHYFVLLRQIRDLHQIKILAGQMTGGNAKRRDGILAAYKDATEQRNYGYLLISLHPRNPPELLLRSNIFPDEDPFNIVYRISKSI